MIRTIMAAVLVACIFSLAAQEQSFARAGLAKDALPRNAPANVTIHQIDNSVQLGWDAFPGASAYKVYSSAFPDAGFVEDQTGVFNGTSWSTDISDEKRFYYVTYVSPIPDDFVLVQAGTIYPPDGDYQSGLTVSNPYYVDRYEVTSADWNAVMGTGGGDNFPKAYVSWLQFIEYCNLRSMQEGLTPCFSYLNYGTNPNDWPAGWKTTAANRLNVSCDFSAIGYRLLTDAEWEFAGRGGLETQGYIYAGSDDINVVGWWIGNNPYPDHASQVGLLAPNELGIFDMSGNMHEFCWDAVSAYGFDWNSRLRGGGWNGGDWGCAMWHRYYSNPANSTNYIGFRLGITAP